MDQNRGSVASQKRDALGWVAIAVFWIILYALGEPLPFSDDLFLTGAAINMAAGHGFTNPFCPEYYTLGSTQFYYYLPLHSYILAGWIKLFGLSRSSLAFFQCTASALACFGLWRVMRDEKTGLFLPLGISVCVAIYLGSMGLRPEALGLAFMAWGTLLLKSKSWLSWALCGEAIFLSLITSPTLIALGCVFKIQKV